MSLKFLANSVLLTAVISASAFAQNLEQFAKEHLPKGAELAHPPIAGSFGPPGRHVLLLYRTGENIDEAGEFNGLVFLEAARPQELPGIGLLPHQFATEVKAVFFENADGTPDPELFVLYAYHRNGSETDDSHACLIYQWQGDHFARIQDVERKVVGLSTAYAVRQRIRRSIPTLKKPADYRKK